jgi:hypothetical protein
VHHEEQVLIDQIREQADNVLKNFLLLLSARLHSSLAQDFVCEVGEELRHRVLADVDVDELREGELQLSCEESVLAEALVDHVFVIGVHLE